MKRRNILGLATAAGFMLAATVNAAPPVTTGLKLHLDASQLTGLSDGATVTTWTDMSGLGNNATAGGTPIYKTGVLNGEPVIRFNNASSFTTANLSSQFPTAATVFIVTTISSDDAYTLVDSNGHADEWWRYNVNGRSYPALFRGSRLESYCDMPNSGSHVFAISSSASAWEMAINGASQGVKGGAYNAGGVIAIGNGSTGGGLNGDIAEVIIYDRVLDAGELGTVGGYLTVKYGLVTSYPTAPQATIMTFGLPGMPATINQTDKTISWSVRFDSNPAALSPTFSLSSGATCTVGGVPAVSGETRNFTSPVDYTVTSSDNLLTNTYTVTVTVAPPVPLKPVTNGLALFLDASQLTGLSDGATVTTWTDMSGLGNNATTTAGTPIYKTGVLNGQPVVRFNGSSKMTLADLSSSFPSAASIFAVITPNNDNMYSAFGNRANDERWMGGNWSEVTPGAFRVGRANFSSSYSQMPSTGSHIFVYESSSSAYKFLLNGNLIGTAAANYHSGSGGTWGVGYNGINNGAELNGDIAELILYNRVLSAEEADQVGAYLSFKYGLTTSYPPPGPPVAPTGLTASPLYQGVLLNWTASTEFGITGYNVYRGTVSGTYAPTPIGTTTSPTTYNDMTVTSGGPYYYVVKATNSVGEGAASNEASASPAAGAVDQTITFALGLAVTKTATDAPFADTASAFPSGSAVTYSVTPAAPTVATVDAATGVVTLMGSTGTVYVVASVEATPGYNAATNTQTLTVNQAIPVITWTSTPIVVGTYLSDTQLNATSGGVPGAFVYTPASGTLMDVLGPQNLSVQFTPTDTVKYSTPALKTVEFLVVPVETTVIWDTGAGTWNTTVANWKGQSSGLTTIFTQGNNAIFNSSAGGAITIASGMAPLTTTVSATSGTYTFGGGPIAGTGSLTKSGNGVLTLDASNTYTGGTVINAGQLTMNTLVNGALGTGTVTLNGGTLRLERITIGNALTVNGGILSCSNGWGCNWNGPITLNSNLTVSGDGNSGQNTFNGIISGVGGLTFNGPAVLWPVLKVANTYTGPTSVTACTLRCDNKDSLGSGALSLSTTGKLNLNYTGTKTVASLTLGGVAKTAVGTYGSVASGADYRDDTYFVGTGTVRIAPPKGTVISFF